MIKHILKTPFTVLFEHERAGKCLIAFIHFIFWKTKGSNSKIQLGASVPRLSELLGIQNVRFYKEEEKNEPEFAKKLASIADLYVNDAFGTAHRAHASTEGVTKFLKPSVAGFLLQKVGSLVPVLSRNPSNLPQNAKRCQWMNQTVHLSGNWTISLGAVSSPKRPFAAIVGGSKVSSKIGVIESLLEKPRQKEYLSCYPTDVVIADKFAPDANSKIVPASAIPDGWMGLDIGPDSIKIFNEALETTKTVIWNGPMGVFELISLQKEQWYARIAVAKKLAELSGKDVTTIIGGGDSVAAVEKVGVADVMSHISTGGGASLELLEGKELPGVVALDEATPVPV
ncbi:Phosphoglycerate kinase 2, chloroplastic [Vitis vinifera]|uniref:Phosphoglycerate kinase n=1 Tax=Vitis vinifera TaxID=29760 RepID=A0A438G9F8_VITVI|nr:Phosphoglycerate kinase 2, chloroplastic [Vitis vinifera]